MSKDIRVNNDIRSPKVLLIDMNGDNLGEIAFKDAMYKAETQNLDLVEVGENKGVPVCKILDFGKWKYEQSKSSRKGKQHKQLLKEIKFRPTTSQNDLSYRAKHTQEFLKEGHKVKIYIKFKGREIEHMYEIGSKILENFLNLVDMNLVNIDTPAKAEGNSVSMILAPK